MQHRPGPNWNGPWGLLQSLADALKLHFKEGIIPARADKVVYILAPAFAAIPAFLIFSIIPVGGEVTMFGEQTALQLIDPPVGVLVALALASIGVYGIVLGGWASGSTYPLLGGLRVGRADDLLRRRDGTVVRRRLPLLRHAVHLGDRQPAGIAAGTSGCCRCRSSSTASRWSARPTGRRSTWPRPRGSWSAGSTPSTPRCASGCSSWPNTST